VERQGRTTKRIAMVQGLGQLKSEVCEVFTLPLACDLHFFIADQAEESTAELAESISGKPPDH